MKKTKIVAVKMGNTDSMIEALEEQGFEIVEFKHEIADNGDIYILLKAQKEEDKSIYEKIYLLEKYCTNYIYKHSCLCKGCRIENMCDKYEGCGIAHWDFEDVEKAYEEIRDDR